MKIVKTTSRNIADIIKVSIHGTTSALWYAYKHGYITYEERKEELISNNGVYRDIIECFHVEGLITNEEREELLTYTDDLTGVD